MKKLKSNNLFLTAISEQSIADFFLEEKCRQWILNKLHPEGPNCPRCRKQITSEVSVKRFWSGERLSCISCGTFFNALTGTGFSGVNLRYREIYVLALLITLKRDNRVISECLHLSQKTVRFWRDKFIAMERLKELHTFNNEVK